MILESKLYTRSQIENFISNVSIKENIPKEWLFFNVGTEKHIGTIIKASLIKTERFGCYINTTAFEIENYVST